MKKILFALFVSFVLCFARCPGLTAFAAGDNVGETIGYVTDIRGDVVHVTGEPLTESGFEAAAVRIGNAPVYDLRTGERVSKREIFRDTDVRIAYFVPESGPLQMPLSAVVVWLNWNEDDAAVFTVRVSENIYVGADSTVFLCADGKYRVELTPDTVIYDPLNGLISHREVTPGMEFFVWVDILTASTPALIYPDKVVVVR